MTKYLISWTEEDWFQVTVEAESSEQALQMFHNREFDDRTIMHIGGEMQDSIDIEEI